MEPANTAIEPIIIFENITLADVRAAKPKKIFYAANTCWWTHDPAHLGRKPDSGLPCDPRGSVLFETEDVEGFLQAAEAHPEHYGKHGLRAFLAAHHQNACLNGRPWSAGSWDSYNSALDRLDLQKAAGEIVLMSDSLSTPGVQPVTPQLSTRELIAALRAGKVFETGTISLEHLEAVQILTRYGVTGFPIAVLLKTLRERDQELILRSTALDAAKQLNEQLRLENAGLKTQIKNDAI